tara:strand:- start:2737 stop:3495 length:759 start_codon:yes stop_codon:yes gene_type:complete
MWGLILLFLSDLIVGTVHGSIATIQTAPQKWLLAGCKDVFTSPSCVDLQAVLLADTYTSHDAVLYSTSNTVTSSACQESCTLDLTCIAFNNNTDGSCTTYKAASDPLLSVNAYRKKASEQNPISISLPFDFPTAVAGSWPRTLLVAGNNVILDIQYGNTSVSSLALNHNTQTSVSFSPSISTSVTISSVYVIDTPGVLFLPMLLTDDSTSFPPTSSDSISTQDASIAALVMFCCVLIAATGWLIRDHRRKKN